MANKEHIDILGRGVNFWNKWRKEHPDLQPDLSEAVLQKAYLFQADLSRTNLSRADLSMALLIEANLKEANLEETNLFRANLAVANLNGTDLRKAKPFQADFGQATLRGADLRGVVLYGTNFRWADLEGANLSGANLTNAILADAKLDRANLTGCFVYGVSAWDVSLKNAIQESLIITREDELAITVDNLEIAQFIHLLLSNQKIRDVIDAITSKVVLILGRFTPERKAVLDAIKNELRKHDKLPVLFDFKRPTSRDLTETVRTLAHLSQFIIADLTDPGSIPHELKDILPDLEVPVQPILVQGKNPHAMYPDLLKYPWVSRVFRYKDQAHLIASLPEKIIQPAEKKARQFAIEKAKRPGAF